MANGREGFDDPHLIPAPSWCCLDSTRFSYWCEDTDGHLANNLRKKMTFFLFAAVLYSKRKCGSITSLLYNLECLGSDTAVHSEKGGGQQGDLNIRC